MQSFCRFFKNGLVYNNDTTHFTISPCCYFNQTYRVDQSIDRSQWSNVDVTQTCQVCIDQDNSGRHSYRKASFDQTTGLTDQIEFLTVAVNKTCNLACPSCDSRSSSFWYQENIRNNITQSSEIHTLHQEDRNGTTTKEFIKLLSDIDLSKLTYIKFGGGEPLMSDTHEQILNLIPNPELVTVHYTSNFSIMPSARVFDLWNKFKLIKWVASIDGVGDQFTFLRWPYKYQNAEKFIQDAKIKVPGNVMFGIEHTVNVLNAFYFNDFESWMAVHLKSNRFNDPSDLNLHACYGVLSLNNLPTALRNVIKDKFGKNHTISTMIDQHPYSGNTQELIQYLDHLDQVRDQSWRSTFPAIQQYII